MTLPSLPGPDRQQAFFCNKCGSFGNGNGLSHNRADGSACYYQGVPSGPFFTADQMRAYAELAIASVKREPLSLKDIDLIRQSIWPHGVGKKVIPLVRAIEQAHGIGVLDDQAQPIKYPSSTESQWLPIESAPQTSDEILVLSTNGRRSVETGFFVQNMTDTAINNGEQPLYTAWTHLPPVTATTASKNMGDE